MADINQPLEARESQNKILSNQEIIEKILFLQKQALENANYYIQLTYCDTSFCHRFVHFEVDPDYIEQFEPILNEYIDSLKTLENDGILHYHLQEMPSKAALARMDPHDNPLMIPEKGKKKNDKKKQPMKDLFGGLIEDGDGLSEEQDSEADILNTMGAQNDPYTGDIYEHTPTEKSYTLTIISDPEESGIDRKYLDYQRFMLENHASSGYTKPKRLVINANQGAQTKGGQGKMGPMLMSAAEDERFRKNT